MTKRLNIIWPLLTSMSPFPSTLPLFHFLKYVNLFHAVPMIGSPFPHSLPGCFFSSFRPQPKRPCNLSWSSYNSFSKWSALFLLSIYPYFKLEKVFTMSFSSTRLQATRGKAPPSSLWSTIIYLEPSTMPDVECLIVIFTERHVEPFLDPCLNFSEYTLCKDWEFS